MADVATEALLAALNAELASLRVQVEGLTRDLRTAQGHVDLTMRGRGQCRVCGCKRIAHALKILDSSEGGQRLEMALFQPSIWRSKTHGKLEAYICTACGIVEWYVKDPGTLEEHEDHLRILDGTVPDPGPFR